MSAKRQGIPHVPAFTEVIPVSPPSSSPHSTSPRNAGEPVTLAGLASQVEEIKDQVAIMVEWLRTLDERTADED